MKYITIMTRICRVKLICCRLEHTAAFILILKSWLTAVVCIGFGVVQEFAADGDENPYFSLTLVSGLLAAALVITCVCWFFTWKKHGKSAAVIPCVAVATALTLLIERTIDTGDHRLFFVYGIMAANLYIIGHMAFALRKAAEE